MKAKIIVCLFGLAVLSSATPIEKEENDNNLEETKEGIKKNYGPCALHECAVGKECRLDEDGKPMCDCAKKCPPEPEIRAQICSDKNVTFDSECDFHRLKCLCHRHEEGCPDKSYAHMHVDYFGPCKEMETCSEYEMKEFPYRMREWLFYVMEELATREELTEPAKVLVKKAEKKLEEDIDSETKKWMIPVVWKFCDIDESHDSALNKHEMRPMVAPIKYLEPCLAPFLDKCDENGSGDISIQEWTKCLLLNPDEVEMRCSVFQEG